MMQTKSVLTFVFLFGMALTACQQKPEVHAEQQSAGKSRYDSLLQQFKEVNFDTLRVATPVDDDSTSLFAGKALDSSMIALLPATLIQEANEGATGVFACCRFAIGTQYVGLIARTPSMYSSTSIKLMLLDKSKDSIVAYKELAELFGDAGDYYIKTSWLMKNQAGEPLALQYVLQGHVPAGEDTGDTVSLAERRYDILELSHQGMDTLSTDQKGIRQEFNAILMAEQEKEKQE